MSTKSHTMSLNHLQRKCKVECMRKHKYPEIPLSGDDDVSTKRNLQLLKEESLKPKPSHESIKTLMVCTHSVRRAALLDSQYSRISCTEMLHLCKAVYLHDYL